MSPTPSEPLQPNAQDPGPILWAGRPEVGPRLPDLVAGLAAGLAVAGVLLAKLLLFDVLARPPRETLTGALTQAAGYGAVWGLATTLARASTAGWVLRHSASFVAAVAVGAIATGQEGLALGVALAGAAVTTLLLLARAGQRRNLRYQVTARAALLGEDGRYVIAFPIEAPPTVQPDRFGDLAQVEFEPTAATLTTRGGRVFQVPPRRRQFLRVRDAAGLLAALESPAAPASD